MSLSKECQEYHLTPRGWVEGSFEGDILGGCRRIDPPEDRILTVRCYDERTSIHSEPFFYDRVAWESDNVHQIRELKQRFGERPDWFGYKLMKQ